ncbi:MAG: DUF305 domain-containing protein, partial [Pseudomonadota bacterium]
SDYLTENEIAAAALADQGTVFNPQQQFRVSWPAEPVVAKAYADQIERAGAMPEEELTELRDLISRAEAEFSDDGRSRSVARALNAMARDLEDATGPSARTMAALSETLSGMAERLR